MGGRERAATAPLTVSLLVQGREKGYEERPAWECLRVQKKSSEGAVPPECTNLYV